ncbi:MAG: L-serine ammonia-lyase, iron-sulfur-dependent subunit beta [Agathobacter sp.]|uniref:L-serine ammonia-lyase, iron-sulfur-dependent subunit beta n=1 Tax=Agathobacter sp. TaxID=2021311 RepID=UPI002585D5EF|nr:L-serine ammonia-lyase, iron-sulfur-dependent subunit beta [Agathobacter sp.]MCR5676877.1 L-serine ammonia-lyase, iron-sulfur-dependent subunit beta [Agathobacter sp.]
MNLFDIVGPVMVGPSSSHTAGAVKIGNVCNKLMGEPIAHADIYLHGSFAATGKGHGTDKALVAGLLGMEVDDIEIPNSFALAKARGMAFAISSVDLGDVHPNSVKIVMQGVSGRVLEVIASSIGGGRIQINKLDGCEANFSGELPTLIVRNYDQPGCITTVTGHLGDRGINIATMQLHRKNRGGEATMVIECDQQVPEETIQSLEHLEGIYGVAYFSPKN